MGSKILSTEPSSSQGASSSRSVKKEASEDEIKDYAETAMNELLGWYGYEHLELRRWPPGISGAKMASANDQGNAVNLPGSRRDDPGTSPDHGTNSTNDKDNDDCSWCNNPIKTDSEVLQPSVGTKYCSELCFSQSRRANFKRAKTCDWCRHVRHTVSYVDFQDGATQLQFCSDKCLNQYKMHIFCRETQAHLDLNPHLVNVASSSNLITPDLWLKNCKSRSVSPASDRTASPIPENLAVNPSVSPKTATLSSPASTPPLVQKSPMPLISVTPTSKLMQPKLANSEEKSPHRKENRSQKLMSRKRRISRCSPAAMRLIKPPDLRLMSPVSTRDGSPSSTASSSVPSNLIQSPPISINSRLPQNPIFPLPPPPFLMNPAQPGIRPPLLHNYPFLPRLPNFFPQDNARFQFPGPPPHLGIGQPPPVTVLVPYPVILPIPLPIPIPIPILDIAKALRNKEPEVVIKTEAVEEDIVSNFDVPLDFTMHNDRNEKETEERPNDPEVANAEQTIPRFKITRLGTKVPKIVTKTKDVQESTRPLRKRRRLVEVASDEECNKTRKTVHV